MTRRMVIPLVVAMPVLLFVNVFQAYRYSQLERDIARLEETQERLIEENKRAILAISVLSSPQRIGPLAEDELGLSRVTSEEIIRMQTGSTGGSR